ncbi:MAG TPA: mechanosensitive ion channel family protein [Bryobacteraceae bacterium]|jgi:small conductance mechanosensitive channel
MDLTKALETIQLYATPVAFRLVGAIVIWIIGRWVIKFIVGLMSRAFTLNKFDATLIRYMASILQGALTVFLALAVIDYLGIPTTSFAALAAGVGLAIGAAWSGILGNFAAGVFMILMRPFKVGDSVSGGGTEGRIKEIGLFITKFENPEGEETLVPNGKLFGGNITNHSTRTKAIDGSEELEVEFQVAFGFPHRKRGDKLKAALATIDGVDADSVELVIARFTVWGPVLVAKLRCPMAKALGIHEEITEAIDEAFGDMGFGEYPAPRMMYKDSKGKKEKEEEGAEKEEGEKGEEEEGEEEEGKEAEGGGEKEE